MSFLNFLKSENQEDISLYEKAMKVSSDKEAREIMRQLKQTHRTANTIEEELDKNLREFLGYRAASYDDNVRRRVEKYFNTEHPYFGKLSLLGKPTASEAYQCGLRNITLQQLRSETKTEI